MFSILRRTASCVTPAAPRVEPASPPRQPVWPQVVVVVIVVVAAAVLAITGLRVQEVLALLSGAVMIGAAASRPGALTAGPAPRALV